MTSAAVPFLVACLIASASCSGSAGTSSCVFGVSTMPGDQPIETAVCREWTGASDQVAARQQDCVTGGTTTDAGIILRTEFSNGPCSRTGIVGGCRSTTSNGITHTDWYYSNEAPTVSDVMYQCTQAGATFVPPP